VGQSANIKITQKLKELIYMEKLPDHFRKYFWDCDFEKITMNGYPFFIIERLLNYGDEQILDWLLPQIDKAYLKKVIEHSRNLDKKTRNYWNILLHE
jgi:hypothetical protein